MTIPVNRFQVLSCIRRHLLESQRNSGEVRPLGEIVPLVVTDLRQGIDLSRYRYLGAIPVPCVASFLEGTLSEREEQAVCHAVLTDNSIVAELIAAVRAMEQADEDLEPLSRDLSLRLLGMVTTPGDASRVAEVDATVQEKESWRSPSILADFSSTPSQTIVDRDHQPGRKSKAFKRKTWVVIAIASSLGVAATLIGIAFGVRSLLEDPSRGTDGQIVEETGLPHLDQDRIDFESVEAPSPKANLPENLIPNRFDKTSIPDVANDPPAPSASKMLADKGGNEGMEPKSTNGKKNSSENSPNVPLEIHWSKISGLLVRRSMGTQDSNGTRESDWMGVQVGTRDWIDSPNENVVHWTTLPVSRAEAELPDGSRFVLAEDTSVQYHGLSSNVAQFEIESGAMAFLDWNPGRSMKIVSHGQEVALLQWESTATAMVELVQNGIQIHVEGGGLKINGIEREGSSLISREQPTPQSLDKPKRLPAWVQRSSENVPIPRTVLAQIAGAEDAVGSIRKAIEQYSIARNGADTKRVAILMAWHASLADDHLFRLLGNRQPALRLAAFERLLRFEEWEPRYERIWKGISMANRDLDKVKHWQAIVDIARRRGRPDAEQLEVLSRGLEAPDVASRALSDLLLRKLMNGGPPFDPMASGPALNRSAAVWRRFIASRP